MITCAIVRAARNAVIPDINRGGKAPVVIAQVVGGVHRADPALRGVPSHPSICIDAAYTKVLSVGQIGVGQPGDVEVGVVHHLAAKSRYQVGVGGSRR